MEPVRSSQERRENLALDNPPAMNLSSLGRQTNRSGSGMPVHSTLERRELRTRRKSFLQNVKKRARPETSTLAALRTPEQRERTMDL